MVGVLSSLFTGWDAEPVPLLLTAAGIALYVAGGRQLRRVGGIPPTRVEVACLVGAVAAILIALVSPLDGLALQLQWAHMTQHLLLLLVAPPLLVLARPLLVGGTALPPALQVAPRIAAALQRSATRRALCACGAVVLFVGFLWVWHVPALYDLTLSDQFVHDMEHTTFFAVGLLFWAVATPKTGTQAAIGMVARSVVVLAGMVGSWLLAVYIGYAPTVLYNYHGAGGLSATADQQLAAGVMWVPGSLPFLTVIIVLVGRWFENDARAAAAELRQAAEAQM